uniref:Uncharacterized protein n=1 Tax=Manihot esculenta TaxID=3983 RepID=A0A2C9V1H5_MANES
MGGRRIPSSVPSTMRPLTAQDGEFVKMKPRLNKKQRVFGGREATGCLPKGFRHSSTPSRYVNNEPFVSCSIRCQLRSHDCLISASPLEEDFGHDNVYVSLLSVLYL